MKYLKNNWGYIISFVLFMLFLIYIGNDYKSKKNMLQEFSKNIFYMDTYINVKIYSNDKEKSLSALEEVDNLYKMYHQLVDRYNEYELTNIYSINNSNSNDDYLNIDNKLYELIEYGLAAYKKTNGLININMGDVIDVWKSYREKGSGVPTITELRNTDIDINEIVLKDGKILNNNPNIDLGALAKGYVTQKASEYLESIGFDKYLINAGGNVSVGNHYDNDKYKVGVEDPTNENDIYSIVKGNNICITSSGDYQRYYEYEGIRYHHIIDPNTLYPSNYTKSVTIITKDCKLGDMLSTTLFLMSIEDGKEFLKEYDAEAIWYTLDDEIEKTAGFGKYE